ncbi:MAG: FG-GAP-like repeat-containing protein [Candidatus Zixiibacteriota bacterium]
MRNAIVRLLPVIACVLCLITPLIASGYTFEGDLSLPAVDWPYGMKAFDMQGDGGQDLLFIEAGNYNPIVILNRHDSTFAMEKIYEITGVGNYYCLGTAHGDVNGDSFEDLIIGADTDVLDNIVMIWLNDGSGNYTWDTSYNVANSPNVVLYEDFNGDTNKDIMICTSNVLNLLLNLGDGTFDTAIPITGGVGWIYCMEAIDVDNDNDMDVVYGLDDRDSVRIKYNDGSGNFDSTVTYPCGDRPYYMASGYFNDDPYMDFVIGLYYENYISVFINNGDGTFADSVKYANAVPVRSIDVADLDNDGRPEILTSSRNNHAYSIYPNNGDGTFGTRQDSYFYYPTEIYANDMDGDGNTDLLIGSTEGFIVLKYGDGTLNIGPDNSGLTEANFNIADVQSADLDGNGFNDLVSVGFASNNVLVLLNNEDSTFVPGGLVSVGSAPFRAVLGDFDHANGIDIAVANQQSDNMTVILNNGGGSFTTGTNYVCDDWPVDIATGDFNNDTYLDLAVVTNHSDSLSVYLNNGDGSFAAKVDYFVQYGPNTMDAIDMNGDTYVDIIVGSNYGLHIFFSDGSGAFDAPVFRPTESSIMVIGATDVDGDLDNDIVAFVDDSLLYITYLNDGSGDIEDSITAENYGNREISTLDFADIDKDGDLDLAYGYESGYYVTVMSNRGNGMFEYSVSYAMPHYAASACLTDIDGDTWVDLVTGTSHYSSSDEDSIFVFWNNQQTFPLDIDDEPANLPLQYSLKQNHPNPFNPTTAIEYSLVRNTHVTIEVYNILGQSLRTLIDEDKPAGDHTVYWDGKDRTGSSVASGIYFYRMVTKGYSETRKMLLIK